MVTANTTIGNGSEEGPYRTDIQKFYRGTNVLITGATGFVGKVLLEKLLRSCPGINNVYLLVRRKDGKDVETRINEMLQKPVFEKLRNDFPGFRRKIVVVEGDCSMEGLGLSPGDRQLLGQRAHVVFHLAATTRPDEPFKNAVHTNVRGTKDLLQLCTQCSNFKGMVVMSTVHCHCYRHAMCEDYYRVPMSDKKALDLVDSLEEEWLHDITPRLLGAWPDTYTLTKAMAEDVVNKYGKNIPVGVFRASSVVSTSADPISGWIDNPKGIMAGVLDVGLGQMRTAHLCKESVANLEPCDMVVSGLVVAAWDVHERKRLSYEEPVVYNAVSSCITWGELLGLVKQQSWHTPFSSASWAVSFTPARTPAAYQLLVLLLHLLPALLVDAIRLLSGHKPKMLRQYRRLQSQFDLYPKVCTQTWSFTTDNVDRLRRLLSDQDRANFHFDFGSLNWEEFVKNSFIGLRTYVLKESPLTISDAIKRRNRLYLLHQLIKIPLLCACIWFFWLAARAILLWTETTDIGLLITNRFSGNSQS